MESKKNKTSPRRTKKKSSSPQNNKEPKIKKKKLSSSPESNNNDKSNENKKNSPKTEKKEIKTEEKEEKLVIKKHLESKMDLDFEETDHFNQFFFKELNYINPIREDKESQNDRISSALKKMETGDDMDILNELIHLREFLSMSSERIGYNPNIGKLLEEICKNLIKTYLPEMIIYSLQCINYIIDINPSLCSILKKINAISTIMNTITAVEDITCVDHIITIFEKISTQNSRLLLENKVFESFLINIFDFLNNYQKKSIMKICYNITSKRISIQEYNLYIKPTMNVLINLTFLDDNDEQENIIIVEKATNIFYNIINQIKNEIIFESSEIKEIKEIKEEGNNNNEKKDENIVDEIIKSYNIIENFKLILDKFFLKNSKIISEQLIHNILRIIVIILEISQEGINKILSNKFLELISEIINTEFKSDIINNSDNNNFNNDNNNIININLIPIKSNINKKFSTFSSEFFDIMNSLFPKSYNIYLKQNIEDKKILKPENKSFYDFFCNNIFQPLINNVMKKSVSILCNNFIKLISSFIQNATKDDIKLFLPSKPISQIIIKLLDTKKYNYVNDSINLIKCLLDKSPENYIVSFVREGIIENLKNLKIEENLNYESKRGKIPMRKYGLSLFDNDYKRYRKEREKYYRKKRDLLVKIKRNRKKLNDILESKDKNDDKNKNDNNNKDDNDDIIKEEDNNKEKEKENEKEIPNNKEEKDSINDKKEIKQIPKDEKEMGLDEDKEKDKEEENEVSEISEKENQEENEENEENEDNENEDEDDNDKDKDEDNEEEEEEQEQEEEEEQDNSDKIEVIPKENENENKNENSEEENNLSESEEKDDIIKLKKIPISSNKKEDKDNSEKEKKEKEKPKEETEDKIDIDKDKEKKDSDKKFDFNLDYEKKTLSLTELMNKKLEKLNEEISKKKLTIEEKLLSRKRKFKFEENLKEKNINSSIYNSESETIKNKIKELLDNYLTEEKIQQFLSLDENKEKIKLIKIKETLNNCYNEIFSENSSQESKENNIKNAIDILLDENTSITLFELETSKILLSFCHFFGPEFNSIYNQLKPDSDFQSIDELVKDLKERKIFPEQKQINFEIYNHLNKFISFFTPEKISKFINILNESIIGMNNTILNLNDKRHGFLGLQETISPIRIKISYNEEIFKDKVLKENLISDASFKTKLCELNTFFFTNKKLILSLNETTTFKTMGIILLATANTPLISNNKYDIVFDFYVEIKTEKKEEKENKNKSEDKMIIEKEKENEEILEDFDEDINMLNDENMEEDEEEEEIKVKFKDNNKKEDEIKKENNEDIKENKEEKKIEKEKETENENKIEIYNINGNITYKEFVKDFSEKYKNIVPNIQFGLAIKPKKNETILFNPNNNIEINDNNKIIIEIENELSDEEKKGSNYKEYYSPYMDKITEEINFIDFTKYSLIKEYHENILYNKYTFFSKSLSPPIYLLSLLNLALIKYPHLFQIQKSTKELKKLFYNQKLDSFTFKISSNPKKILEQSFPYFANYISNNNNHELTKFQTRLLSFKTSFNPQYKSMINLQNFFKHNNPELAKNLSITLKKTMRLKINVEREKIIEHAFNIINDSNFSDFIGYLEFEYKGEIGNGLGPTLEFYTLISDKIKADQNLWYKTTDGSLYPKLIDEKNNNNLYNIQMFKLLGYIVGRAIYDDRLLDIPLNKIFWDRVLNRGLFYESLKYIDINLYKTIQDFIGLIKQKNEYIKNNKIQNINEINFDEIILYNKCKLSELDIYFTFPGYDINLKPDGENILLTMNNIEEYINLIYDFIFFKGINSLINSFRNGFNMSFDINKMQCFTSQEIEENICGSKEIKWEINNLYENLKPEHGYTKQSKIFNDLIKFMCSLDDAQKKKFLIFSTGSSRLPIGGFKSLSPKLTVVKKYCEEGSNPNDFLPTVMTCQNYLKIPEYSRYDILEKKILMAMEEGCNEFSLS